MYKMHPKLYGSAIQSGGGVKGLSLREAAKKNLNGRAIKALLPPTLELNVGTFFSPKIAEKGV